MSATSKQKIRIYSSSQHFWTLMKFNPWFEDGRTAHWMVASEWNRDYDLGNGHLIQRLERGCGLTPQLKPHGVLYIPNPPSKRSGVVLHFEAGPHSTWQRAALHPRARMVYPENMQIIQKYIDDHPGMKFIEVGSRFSGLRGVQDRTGIPLEETLLAMRCCEYFLGIISGPYHVASALGLKLICIVNFPDPNLIWLPTLKNISQVESEWFYPQAVHLHQDSGSDLVPHFSMDNLNRAFGGDVYPYWSDEYLDLIYEKL